MDAKYSLTIRWSDDDRRFLALVPKFGPAANVHGDNYESATRAGREVIESILALPPAERPTLDSPWVYQGPSGDIRVGEALLTGSPPHHPRRKSAAVA